MSDSTTPPPFPDLNNLFAKPTPGSEAVPGQPYQPQAQQPYQPQAQQPYQPQAQQPQPPYQPPYPNVAFGAPVAYGVPNVVYGTVAPYGFDPVTGLPYSDKSKLVAGLLQLFLGGLGIGRFYMGNIGMGIAQIVVSFFTLGLGVLWPFIDGIVILAGNPRDPQGRPLRP